MQAIYKMKIPQDWEGSVEASRRGTQWAAIVSSVTVTPALHCLRHWESTWCLKLTDSCTDRLVENTGKGGKLVRLLTTQVQMPRALHLQRSGVRNSSLSPGILAANNKANFCLCRERRAQLGLTSGLQGWSCIVSTDNEKQGWVVAVSCLGWIHGGRDVMRPGPGLFLHQDCPTT